jgi:hypothetical protein
VSKRDALILLLPDILDRLCLLKQRMRRDDVCSVQLQRQRVFPVTPSALFHSWFMRNALELSWAILEAKCDRGFASATMGCNDCPAS